MSLERYATALAAFEEQNRLRRLMPAAGADFASNDYLGLAHHPAIKQAVLDALDTGTAIGAGAARLLRGNHPAHEQLEEFAAAHFATPSALYLATGYSANFALFSTLAQAGDAVFFDSLSHASTREGIYASKAERVELPHNDPTAFDDALTRWRAGNAGGQAWIAIESLYSMDGDFSPLAEFAAIARAHDAMLVIDEAHATGVHGASGRGLSEQLGFSENIILVHTCGKALGVQGALICAAREIIEYLVNKARPFVFSTAPSPLMAVAVKRALELVARTPERRTALKELYGFAHQRLGELTDLPSPPSQIIPVILGDDQSALDCAAQLQTRGFDVRAIRPPTVPEGTARLRVSITLNVSLEQIVALTRALATQGVHAG